MKKYFSEPEQRRFQLSSMRFHLDHCFFVVVFLPSELMLHFINLSMGIITALFPLNGICLRISVTSHPNSRTGSTDHLR